MRGQTIASPDLTRRDIHNLAFSLSPQRRHDRLIAELDLFGVHLHHPPPFGFRTLTERAHPHPPYRAAFSTRVAALRPKRSGASAAMASAPWTLVTSVVTATPSPPKSRTLGLASPHAGTSVATPGLPHAQRHSRYSRPIPPAPVTLTTRPVSDVVSIFLSCSEQPASETLCFPEQHRRRLPCLSLLPAPLESASRCAPG